MFKTKRANVILSLVIAIALWGYVIGEVNPTITETYKNVPITYLNEDAFSQSGLAIAEASDQTVDVTISGSRAKINNLEASDITATINLSELTKGSNILKINVDVPDNVKLVEKSISRVEVLVEDMIMATKSIEVKFTGEVADQKEATAIDLSLDSVSITGAKSLVNKVDHVSAVIDVSKLSDQMKSLKADLIPVDANGDEVKNVTVSTKTIQVTAIIYDLKTVNLEVPITGVYSTDYLKSVSVPKTITIKGSASKLKNITKITSETIDVSKTTKSENVAIVPQFISEIGVADSSKNLIAKVTVSPYASKTFTYSTDDVAITGSDGKSTPNITSDKIKVTIVGVEEVINALTAKDISLSVDVSDLAIGTYKIALSLNCESSYGQLTADPAKVAVKIE